MEYFEVLKALRIDNDYSQKQIAEKLFTTQQQYQLYESGKRTFPIDYIVKLCEFYNVSADYVLGLPEKMPYPER